MRRAGAWGALVAMGLIAGGGVACAGARASYPAPDRRLDPWAQTKALGRGVNLGNFLDAKPDEGAWTNGRRIQESDLELARSAGFDSVRLPVRFSAHAASAAPYTIDPAFLARVDQVIGWGLARGLRMVLVIHHYDEIHQDPAAHRGRFVALWQQLAAHYRRAPDELYFELLNEPNGKLDAAWNELVAETLQAIRSVDPHHTVVVGCASWSNPEGLEGLRLPDGETNAIVTFHYYTPHLFTFQGKPWMGPDWKTTGIAWPGPPEKPVPPADGVAPWVKDWIQRFNTQPAATNPGGEAYVRNEIAAVAAWGAKHRRPLWMSEFTAQDGAPLASRARWIAFVRSELERQGIPWSFWSLDSDAASKLYEVSSASWTPELTQALGLKVKGE